MEIGNLTLLFKCSGDTGTLRVDTSVKHTIGRQYASGYNLLKRLDSLDNDLLKVTRNLFIWRESNDELE